jgi:hypothetical protein
MISVLNKNKRNGKFNLLFLRDFPTALRVGVGSHRYGMFFLKNQLQK